MTEFQDIHTIHISTNQYANAEMLDNYGEVVLRRQ